MHAELLAASTRSVVSAEHGVPEACSEERMAESTWMETLKSIEEVQSNLWTNAYLEIVHLDGNVFSSGSLKFVVPFSSHFVELLVENIDVVAQSLELFVSDTFFVNTACLLKDVMKILAIRGGLLSVVNI
jgi:hypothetical protein